MTIHHIGIEVRNLEISIQFYQDLLDLYPRKSFVFLNDKLVFMEGNGVTLELILIKENSVQCGRVHFAIKVDHLIAKMKQLEKKRLKPVEGPYFLDNGWKTAFYQGPDDEIIELIEEE